jgi:hypothetical protein
MADQAWVNGSIQPKFSAQRLDTAPAEAAPKDQTCYTIRSYQFSREASGSDAMKLDGYTTCQRASQFQMKDADAAPRLVNR